jgi:hypothetical protein
MQSWEPRDIILLLVHQHHPGLSHTIEQVVAVREDDDVLYGPWPPDMQCKEFLDSLLWPPHVTQTDVHLRAEPD